MLLGDPLPVPHATVDGWSLSGTSLAHIRGTAGRELATHLHGIELAVETPWTYLRAAELLEQVGFAPMALTAIDAWLSHPMAEKKPEETKALQRHRARLQHRLVQNEPSLGRAHRSQQSP